MAEAVGYWLAETFSSYVGLAIVGNAAAINTVIAVAASAKGGSHKVPTAKPADAAVEPDDDEAAP